jgi:hypothetical protein
MPNGHEHHEEPDLRRVYENGDGQWLEVFMTDEGVIMDAWEVDHDGNDRLVGTVGRMAEEWWEYIVGL